MAIDVVQEAKQQTETIEQTTQAVVKQDGWSQAFDDIMHYDFSGFSTLIAVLVIIVLLKPILFIMRWVIACFIVFMFVKYFLYYAS
jgi:type IV secretory pathway VirB2 component (pilin)